MSSMKGLDLIDCATYVGIVDTWIIIVIRSGKGDRGLRLASTTATNLKLDAHVIKLGTTEGGSYMKRNNLRNGQYRSINEIITCAHFMPHEVATRCKILRNCDVVCVTV
jgi:hypothetical protein